MLVPEVAVDGSFSAFWAPLAVFSEPCSLAVAFCSKSVGFFLLLGGVEGFEDE
jgi:hypothetical protein